MLEVEEGGSEEADETALEVVAASLELTGLALAMDEVDGAYARHQYLENFDEIDVKQLTKGLEVNGGDDELDTTAGMTDDVDCGAALEDAGEEEEMEMLEEDEVEVGGLAPAPMAPRPPSGTVGTPARILIMRLRLAWSRRWGEPGETTLAEEEPARAKRMAVEKRNVRARLRVGVS
jgi:hypothetical protein